MENSKIEKIISTIESLIPEYMQNPADSGISNGNVALCIIAEDGQVLGKLFGKDKIRSRYSFKIAWTKASQVWITGTKTGEYEKLVFTKQIDEYKFGISRPDFIGWEGGQPVTLNDGTKLSIGFSGFRGISDLEIVTKAISILNYI
jgi:glc operon protein GlcG